MDQEFWDERYREHERMWSGNPNGSLVAEVTGMPVGRALDVGCGEGADAVWLARQGWRVTATDISAVALERAASVADAAGVTVEWWHADLTRTPPEAKGFDLVTVVYIPLLRGAGPDPARGLLEAVAPGGTLLVVTHELIGPPPGWRGPDPSEFMQPSEIVALLDEEWTVEVHEPRNRPNPPNSAVHAHDIVLRARRTG